MLIAQMGNFFYTSGEYIKGRIIIKRGKDDETLDFNALKKVIAVARKQPKMLFNVTYFQNLCLKLGIESLVRDDKLVCIYNDKKAEATIISSKNCAQFKCSLKEGITGIRISEFIQVLVSLLSPKSLPPSPHEGAGATAQYYVEAGTKILEEQIN